MYRRAEQIFYASTIALLMAILFVVQPTDSKEVDGLQKQAASDAGLAFAQLLGDEPLFTGVADLWAGVSGFYSQSAEVALALMAPTNSEFALASQVEEVSFALNQFNLGFATPVDAPGIVTSLPENFAAIIETPEVQEEPIYNIVPEEFNSPSPEPQVAGTSVYNPVPNGGRSWITIEDAITRQKYCLAIYNGEVNKYLGECHYEFN